MRSLIGRRYFTQIDANSGPLPRETRESYFLRHLCVGNSGLTHPTLSLGCSLGVPTSLCRGPSTSLPASGSRGLQWRETVDGSLKDVGLTDCTFRGRGRFRTDTTNLLSAAVGPTTDYDCRPSLYTSTGPNVRPLTSEKELSTSILRLVGGAGQ